MATSVKICGITTLDDAQAAATIGCDALGFNFYAGSPRCVEVGFAKSCCAQLPATIWKAGVFVNHTREEVAAIAEAVGLDTLQFSGDEDLEMCQGWEGYRVIKAVRLGGSETYSETQLAAVATAVDIVLFDRFSEQAFGGTGEEIPKEIITAAQVHKLLPQSFLSGGLTPENIAQKVAVLKPAGVDVASGVESAPGRKDHQKMQQFIAAVRKVTGS